MRVGFAASFLPTLAALVSLAGLGCTQVATAPPAPAPAPAPLPSRTPESIDPAKVPAEVKPVLPAKVILDNNVLIFSSGGWKLAPQGRKTIERIVKELHSLGAGSKLVVTGYSSNTGTEARKLAISRQRAEFVAEALISAHVPPEKITVRGLGSEHPIASNAAKDGRLKNQRVEVEFQMSQEGRQ